MLQAGIYCKGPGNLLWHCLSQKWLWSFVHLSKGETNRRTDVEGRNLFRTLPLDQERWATKGCWEQESSSGMSLELIYTQATTNGSAGYLHIFMYVCKTTTITIMMRMMIIIIKGTMNLTGSKGRHGRSWREEREVGKLCKFFFNLIKKFFNIIVLRKWCQHVKK